MTVPTNLRFNLNAPFPSLVTGSGPVTIGKQNGIWTVGFNTANLGIQNPPAPTALATDYVLVYDSVAKQFINVPLSSFTAYTLLNQLTAANSTSLQDTTSLTSAFNDYEIIFENIVPVTNAVHFEIQVQSNAAFQTTGYLNSGGGITTYIDVTQAANVNSGAGFGLSGRVRVYNVNAAVTKHFTMEIGNNTGGPSIGIVNASAAWNGGTTILTGLRFLMSSGNISTGTIKIFGRQ